MTAAEILASSIDDHLGPAQGRFFGHGFRRVAHSVRDVEIRRGAITATAGLSYPDDWSRKSSGSLRPHLSSVDALVLAVQLAEAHLTHTRRLDAGQRRRTWLRSFDMRGGRVPQEDLTALPVQAIQLATRGTVSTYSCLIGTLGVTCEIEHDATYHGLDSPLGAPADTTYRNLDSLLGAPADTTCRNLDSLLGAAEDRYYGAGFRRRAQRIADVRVAPDGEAIAATVAVADPGGGRDLGLGGAYGPAPSMLDGLVCLAQLAQVLAYRLDGIERGQSHTLWMRRLAQSSAAPPRRATGPVTAKLALQRSRVLAFGDGRWRTLDVAGELHGIRVRSSIAHQLPER
jgi:Pseudomonas avirulence D protein (AvrD)